MLCLFILTGFPQIKSPGVTVRYLDYGSDEKEAVILKHFPDRLQSMLIDTTTRKRKMVRSYPSYTLISTVHGIEIHVLCSQPLIMGASYREMILSDYLTNSKPRVIN